MRFDASQHSKQAKQTPYVSWLTSRFNFLLVPLFLSGRFSEIMNS